MKTILPLIIAGVLALIAISCNLGQKNGKGNGIKGNPKDFVKRDQPTGQLIRFAYTRAGTMAVPFQDYKLTLLDDGKVQLYAHNLGRIHDTVPVDREVLDSVARMIVSNEIYRYKSHYEPEMQVMDGEGWHYSAEYDDKTSLSSGGSNARPSNFALPAIADYLDSMAVKAGAGNKGFEDW